MLLPSRRQLLQAGVVPALGLALPELLRAESRDTARRQKHCIFIYQYGGLWQLDSWDPKPDAPAEMRGPYKPIATTVPGFRVGELMPRLAGLAHRYAVIRSMTHNQPVHDVANKMLLAGKAVPEADDPAFGSIVAKLKPSPGAVPSYVWLQKFGGGAAPPDPTLPHRRLPRRRVRARARRHRPQRQPRDARLQGEGLRRGRGSVARPARGARARCSIDSTRITH